MIRPLIAFPADAFPSAFAPNTMRCPCCRAGRVAQPEADFSATGFEVAVCGECRETGIVSVNIRKTALFELL